MTDSTLIEFAWLLSMSASVVGIPLVGMVMLLLASRSPLHSWRQRGREIILVGGILILALGSVAMLNEHVVKPGFHIFRPNILQLATDPPQQPALKISAADFYAMPDKAARSEYLAGVLDAADYNGPELAPLVKQHWIHETGYSFPSGHTTAAAALSSFFLLLALTRFSGWARFPYLTLLPWVMLVGWSRTELQVHTLLDVSVGGLQGLLVGLLAWGVYRLLKAAEKGG